MAFTIEQLIDEHKVGLDGLLVKLAKVRSADIDDSIAKFKHQGRIRVPLCERNNVQVLVSDVEEGGRTEGDDGRTHVSVGDDLDAEDVCNRASIFID